ncbi:MAG: YicC/YloC family endoribonuclease [Hyphomicrobiales bacterium]|uniref:YicC/YloC family endoribonuclease n=1 Tax=Aestuariivirga sp. TaxID=2650926 RepID=UPI0035B3F580
MPTSSMTGFARASGERQGLFWQWEIKSVNGKALDVRLRLPPGFEALETPVRAALAAAFRRGNLQVSLSVSGQVGRETVRLNQDILDRLVETGEALRDRIGGEPLRADVLLSIKGVVEVAAVPEEEGEAEARNAAMLESFGETLAALGRARREEGGRLNAVVSSQVQRIAELADQARRNPSRTPEAIRARLAEQVSRLLETGAPLDPDRLHQEAVIAATRADIQEELDRLGSHVEAAQALLASNEAVGRKFDFLAQEFNREANTLCSKASDRSLTAIGLDLKTVIDQLREQVQNIE